MKDKYLVEKKENFFSRISNFFKSLFSKNKIETEIEDKPQNIESINNENKINKNWNKTIIVKEDPETIKLQQQFESNDINTMTLEDLLKISGLYKRKIEILEEDINYTKSTLNLLQKKLAATESQTN